MQSSNGSTQLLCSQNNKDARLPLFCNWGHTVPLVQDGHWEQAAGACSVLTGPAPGEAAEHGSQGVGSAGRLPGFIAHSASHLPAAPSWLPQVLLQNRVGRSSHFWNLGRITLVSAPERLRTVPGTEWSCCPYYHRTFSPTKELVKPLFTLQGARKVYFWFHLMKRIWRP